MNAETTVFSTPAVPLQSFASQSPLVLVQDLLHQSIHPAGPGSIALSLHIHLQTVCWPDRSILGRHHLHHARGVYIKCSTRPRMERAACPWSLIMKLSPKVPVEHTQEKRGRAWWHGGNFGLLCTCLHSMPASNHWLRSGRLNSFSIPGEWWTACLSRVCQNLQSTHSDVRQPWMENWPKKNKYLSS